MSKKRYRVSWDVEVDADTPAQAALKAFADTFCVPGAPKEVRVTELADAEFEAGVFDILEEIRRADTTPGTK
jgi:hypothetical protein